MAVGTGSGHDQISPNDYKCNPKTVAEGKMITDAADYLDDHIGDTVEDPGYF